MWNIVLDGDVWCVEYDGYYLSFEQLREGARFWPDHIGGKVWGTPDVVADLESIIRRISHE